MTLTPEKLDEIEQLAELATPGPWELRDADNGPHIVARLPENEGKRWDDPVICNLYDDVTPEDSVTIGPWLETLPNALANARLIAALDPTTVRELVRLARIGLTSSGESGVQRGGRAIRWPEGINTAEMPEDGAV